MTVLIIPFDGPTRYNKYLSWVYGVDRKIYHEGH